MSDAIRERRVLTGISMILMNVHRSHRPTVKRGFLKARSFECKKNSALMSLRDILNVILNDTETECVSPARDEYLWLVFGEVKTFLL